jgi:hypothetical protein
MNKYNVYYTTIKNLHLTINDLQKMSEYEIDAIYNEIKKQIK